MRNALQGVAVGLSFLEERQIDLMQRLGSGLFLTREELASFADRCLRRVDGRGAVVRRYAKTRYVAFLNYIEARFEAVLHRAAKDNLKVLKLDFDQFSKRSRAQKPKGRAGAQERVRKGLTPAQRNILLEVTYPDSPRNPFKKKLRKRNRALILLHYFLGLRAGELAGLHRSDYHHRERPPQLFLHVRDNFAGDTRLSAPRAKTRARMLVLRSEAEEALNGWLAHRAERDEFPLAHKSHYIFDRQDWLPVNLEIVADNPKQAGCINHLTGG
jgi:integrase